MSGEPPVLLDVSRLVSRLGRGTLTGIDRVEAEWLAHLTSRDHLLLCRVTAGQLLLPPEAGRLILDWLAGAERGLAPRAHWRDRLRGRGGVPARAEAALRRIAIAKAGRGGRGLGAAARAHFSGKPGAGQGVYFNLGHSNLTPALLRSMAPLLRAVMIHDTIPLDHPELSSPGQPEKFRHRLMAALQLADQIFTVSEAAKSSVETWRARLAIAPRAPIAAVRIGTRLAAPDPAALPAGLDLSGPYFVTIGTIEPRKNHALLLDVWQRLAQEMPAPELPRLYIVGARGWAPDALLRRLDLLPKDGPVVELSGLGDGAVAALLEGARALLMPSRTEGFGLPLTEAAARGVPVLTAPFAAARELLGDYAVYLSPDDIAAWADSIEKASRNSDKSSKSLAPDDWDRHFSTVSDVLARRLLDFG